MEQREKYIAGGYIPYSVEHNIQDPELAGLLDYLEREMGWEITHRIYISLGMWEIHQMNGDKCAIQCNNAGIHFHYKSEDNQTEEYELVLRSMPRQLFFRTYQTLLPVIKNLYSK